MQLQIFKYIHFITGNLIYYTYTQKPQGGAKQHQGHKVNESLPSLSATYPEGNKITRKFLENKNIQSEV